MLNHLIVIPLSYLAHILGNLSALNLGTKVIVIEIRVHIDKVDYALEIRLWERRCT